MQNFIKAELGLVPADEQTREWFAKIKYSELIWGDMRRKRNARFHRKYFAMLQYAFDVWKENLAARGAMGTYKGQSVMPNFERFRKEIAVLCGFYEPVFSLKGEVKLNAKSISFAKMGEDEFDDLYNKTLTLLMDKIAGMPQDKDEVRRIVDSLVEFA